MVLGRQLLPQADERNQRVNAPHPLHFEFILIQSTSSADSSSGSHKRLEGTCAATGLCQRGTAPPMLLAALDAEPTLLPELDAQFILSPNGTLL
jgi:hypothetical protein